MDAETKDLFDNYLKIYYKKLFPAEKFCTWLTYSDNGSKDILLRREFSFTLAGDIYLRYQSFEDAAELRQHLVKICPHKIDLGAVYTASPKIHRSIVSSTYKPLWKELVFDIDLTDYDEIRFCCGANSQSGNALCNLCWQLAQNAVLALDRALREDFGFKHLLWVYSGRRGVHCWVCDRQARYLDGTCRTAVAEYLSVVKPIENRKSNSFMNKNIHPSLDAAYEILYPRFLNYVKSHGGQNLFARKEGIEMLLKMLPNAEMATEIEALRQEFDERPTVDESSEDISLKRWNTLKAFLQTQGKLNLIKEITLHFSYPRLDINVSTGFNHLLKSPFCIHPKTGFICVPFEADKVLEFLPEHVPTLGQVMKELDSANTGTQDTANEQHLLVYKKTSLRPFIEHFEKFVASLEKDELTGSDVNKSHVIAF